MLGLDTYSQSRDVVGPMTNTTLHNLQPWSGVSVVPMGPVGMAARSEYAYQQGWVPAMGFGYFGGNGTSDAMHASLDTRPYEQASSTTTSEDGLGCRGFSPNTAVASADMYDPPPVTPPPQRERFSYTRYQLELLNGIYKKIRYPNSMQKQLVAKRVGITRDQVKIWFQNRRRKDIVGRKGNPQHQVQEELMPSPLMVPETIMKGVITELLKYEKDPSGRLQKSLTRVQSNTRRTPPIADIDDRSCNSPVSEADSTTIVLPTMPEPIEESTPYFLPDSDPCLDVASSGGLTGLDTQAVFPPRSPSVASVVITDDPRRVLMEVPTTAQMDMVAPPNVIAPPSKPRPFMTTHSASRGGVKRPKRESDDSMSMTAENCLPITPPDFYPPNKVASSRQPIRFSGVAPVAPLVISIPGLSSVSPPTMASCRNGINDNQASTNSSQDGFHPEQFQSFGHQYSGGDTTFGLCSLPIQTSGGPQAPPCRNSDVIADPSYAAAAGTTQFHPAQTRARQCAMERAYPFNIVAPDQPVMFHSMCHDPNAEKMAHAGVFRDPYQPFMISSYCGPYYGYDPSLFAQTLADRTYMQL